MKKQRRRPNYASMLATVAVIGVAALAIYIVGRNNAPSNQPVSQSSSEIEPLVDKNSEDYKTYSQLTGDDYDRAFLANMIIHHQAAVNMSALALVQAYHQELKELADAISTAQTTEITDMQTWQQQWDYPPNGTHATMPMSDDMAHMTDSLKNLSGDAFDKAFLTSMIAHHQGAINMASPAETNAKHTEVKTLAKTILTTQAREIARMKQWQTAWGY